MSVGVFLMLVYKMSNKKADLEWSRTLFSSTEKKVGPKWCLIKVVSLRMLSGSTRRPEVS